MWERGWDVCIRGWGYVGRLGYVYVIRDRDMWANVRDEK